MKHLKTYNENLNGTPVKGVIINELVEEDVKKIFPGVVWDKEYDEIDMDSFENWNDIMINKEEELEDITTKYMLGQDDGKFFFFSDCQEGIDAIEKMFPNFPIVEVEKENYPLDYDYTTKERRN